MSEIPLPPGEFIKTILQERGWTQADLAQIVNRHVPAINEIIQGKRLITSELAVDLALALGETPETWMQRETAYRLSLVSRDDPETRRRARLFELAPVKEMEKRGWIKPARSIDDLEKELCGFFHVSSLDEEPRIHASARQTFKSDTLTSAQRAWVFRAAHLANLLNVGKFDQKAFEKSLPEIRSLAESDTKTATVPGFLAELGVRLVIVEPLPRSRIDGAAFWLDEKCQESPVIVLSVRYDRVDWFWHTLAHEIIHIKYGDSRSIDTDLVGESKIHSLDTIEERADREGAEFLVPKEKIDSFIVRMKPFYSKTKILQFSQRIGIHPGIVNGQLQHRKEIPWSANREMLTKIREILVTTAITDGWGKSPLNH